MSKEMIVTLLRKDIAELSQLTDGFEQLEIFPPVLLRLAESKAVAVLENIKALSELPVKVEVPVVEEKHVAFDPVVTILPEKKEEESIETNDKGCVMETVETMKEKDEMQDIVPCEENVIVEPETEFVRDMDVPQKEDDFNVEKERGTEAEVEQVDVSPSCENDAVIMEENVEITEQRPQEPVVAIEKDLTATTETSDIVEKENALEEEKEEENVQTVLADAAKESFTRNDSITNKKIDDIKQAISLGDRFLFQRELFNNNGELMMKTIAYLNGIATMDEALQYINKKFDWDFENPTVERFIQILNRRYL